MKVLWAANTYWESPFQVGANHLAREFASRGWDVAFLSDPVSPWHLLGRPGPTTQGRLKDWARGGGRDLDGRLWHYSPLTLAPPQNLPLLDSAWALDHWAAMSFPHASGKVRAMGFGEVDLLVVDSVPQSLWLKEVRARRTLYRMTDRFRGFDKATPAMLRKERELASSVDLVAYTARDLEKDVKDLGARKSLFLPNGVDAGAFRKKASLPPEYASIPAPRVVYAGAIDNWFNAAWVRAAASALPGVSFVVIGPPGPAAAPLAGLANVHLLGMRPHASLAGYLQHARVGIIPFDVEKHGDLIHAVNPIKLYEYLACGLPVVSSDWRELRNVGSPALLCRDGKSFLRGLGKCLSGRGAGAASRRRFAARHDWSARADRLARALGF